MTQNGYLQLALYVVVLIALAKPLGAYMANVYEGRSVVTRLGAPLENLIYRLCGVDATKEMRWTRYALAMLLFNLLGVLVVYALQRLQIVPPAQPAGVRCGIARLFVQHGSELRDEHQLAGLRWRIHDELPHADACADGAELRLRGHRHGGADRADPRPGASHRADHRQLLGGPHPQHALHPAASLARARGGSREPGRGPDPLALPDRAAGRVGGVRRAQARCRRSAAQGRQGQRRHGESGAEGTDPCCRPRRVADRDQAARHQRRRLLQRQLGAPVREPDAAFQLS